MYSVLERISANIPLYCLLAFINCALGVCTCVAASIIITKKVPAKKFFPAVFSAVLCAVTAYVRAKAGSNNEDVLYLIGAALLLLLNFICIFAFYPGKKCLKPFLVATGLAFTDTLKYIMLSFLSYGEEVNDALELVTELLIAVIVLAVIMAIYISKSKKAGTDIPAVKPDIPLYVLVVLTTSVFITTISQLGINYSEKTRFDFLLALLNIPLVGGTVLYAVSKVIKSKLAEENYRRRLDMQLQHFGQMEKKNEELRVFRHDFSKKLRPAVMYLSDGKTKEAMEILFTFSNEIEASRPRYNTGNFMLDTVLECEQQLAEKSGSNIVLTNGSVFPAEGIEPDDIYTIFPNALDNAIEACEKLRQKCEITVSSRISGDTVYISVKNPCEEKIERNSRPETSKKDKKMHGYGLRSISRAAAKYGSDNVEYFTKDGQFNIRITLQFNKEERRPKQC